MTFEVLNFKSLTVKRILSFYWFEYLSQKWRQNQQGLNRILSYIFQCNRSKFEKIDSLNAEKFSQQHNILQSLQRSKSEDQKLSYQQNNKNTKLWAVNSHTLSIVFKILRLIRYS